MPARSERVLSGWRASRLLAYGGMLVRDGMIFRIYRNTDARSSRCGRVPAHVVARLQAAPGLQWVRGNPDRLAARPQQGLPALQPLAVPARLSDRPKKPQGALSRLVAEDPNGVRFSAAAGRFRGDYHLAASPGRLRSDRPEARAAARARLAAIETALGPERAGLAEMLVLDRFTLSALRHACGVGPAELRDVLAGLAAAYSLMPAGQLAGRASASD